MIVVGGGDGEELSAALPQVANLKIEMFSIFIIDKMHEENVIRYGRDDVGSVERNVLHSGASVVVGVFLNLALSQSVGRFVDGHLRWPRKRIIDYNLFFKKMCINTLMVSS